MTEYVNTRIIREIEREEIPGGVRVEYESIEADIPEGGTLASMQSIVGGLVECIDVSHPVTQAIATLWINGDGKNDGLPRNYVGEAFAVMGGWQGPEFGDWIAGPVVLTGLDPESGDTTSLPPEWGALVDMWQPATAD